MTGDTDPQTDRFGIAVLATPLVAFSMFLAAVGLFAGSEILLTTAATFSGSVLLLSGPFAGVVALRSWKRHRSRFWKAISGCTLGLGLSAFTLFSLNYVHAKHERDRAELLERQRLEPINAGNIVTPAESR